MAIPDERTMTTLFVSLPADAVAALEVAAALCDRNQAQMIDHAVRWWAWILQYQAPGGQIHLRQPGAEPQRVVFAAGSFDTGAQMVQAERVNDEPQDMFEILAENAELARAVAADAADRLTLPQTGMILEHLCDALDAQLHVITQTAERVEAWAQTARSEVELADSLVDAHMHIWMSQQATEAGRFLLGRARGALLDIEREREEPALGADNQ